MDDWSQTSGSRQLSRSFLTFSRLFIVDHFIAPSTTHWITMAVRSSEDSTITRPRLDFSAPSPLGYFDNLFTSLSPSSQNSDLSVSSRHSIETSSNASWDVASLNDQPDMYALTLIKLFSFVTHSIIRSECDHPPCPSPAFFESYQSYHVPIVASSITNTRLRVPLWKLDCKPMIKLSPGLLIQGRFGQGQILSCPCQDLKFYYFLCYIYNQGYMYLLVPAKWQQGWRGYFYSRYIALCLYFRSWYIWLCLAWESSQSI